MPASWAPAWPAFFQACLGPSPARGYSTLQARSAFFPPRGNGSSTKVGTPFLSLPLPSRWSVSAVCYLDSSCVGQRLGVEQAWFFLPAWPFVPRMDSLLSVNRSRDWGVSAFSLYQGLAWSLPTATSCCPSTPSGEGIRWGAGRAPDACALSHLLYLIPLAFTHPPFW